MIPKRSGLKSRKTLAWMALGMLATACLVYLGAVYVTKTEVEAMGRAVLQQANQTQLTVLDVPPGSVVLMNEDTVASLTTLGSLRSTVAPYNSSSLVGGELRVEAVRLVDAAQDFVAIHGPDPSGSTALIFELLPRSKATSVMRGKLLLRTPEDSGRTYAFDLF